MLETIQEIINSPHTDWTTVIIMLSIIGFVLLGIVAAVTHIIVAKIKGWELPEAKIEKKNRGDLEIEDFDSKYDTTFDLVNPADPYFDDNWPSSSCR